MDNGLQYDYLVTVTIIIFICSFSLVGHAFFYSLNKKLSGIYIPLLIKAVFDFYLLLALLGAFNG